MLLVIIIALLLAIIVAIAVLVPLFILKDDDGKSHTPPEVLSLVHT